MEHIPVNYGAYSAAKEGLGFELRCNEFTSSGSTKQMCDTWVNTTDEFLLSGQNYFTILLRNLSPNSSLNCDNCP